MTATADARRTAYILEHLELVDVIAGSIIRRMPASFELDDLRQAGRVGLINAAARYDRSMNVPFGAYARHRIRGEILEACRRRNWREATHEELYAGVRDMRPADVDLDAGIRAGERARLLTMALAGLSPAHRAILRAHYLEQRTVREIGQKAGITAGRASQILHEALDRARRQLRYRGVRAA